MKLRALICVPAICFASLVSAQTIEVRSGEHEDFTRLIVDLPERTKWKISQLENKATLSLERPGIKFDTTSVFKRIPRNRVADLTVGDDDSTLTVTLGCDCRLSPFWHGNSLLVVDIRKNQTDEPEMDSDDIQDLPAKHSKFRTSKNLLTQEGSRAAALFKNQFASRITTGGTVEHSELQSADDENIQIDDNIARSREKLVEQIGRAASQGLLTPQLSFQTTTIKSVDDELNGRSEDKESNVSPPTAQNPWSNINLRAQSSIDRDFMTLLTNQTQVSECSDMNQIDVRSWGSDAEFSEQVSIHRLNLVGEFDEINQDVAIRLGRTYIFYGFGAEARLTLDLVDSELEELDVLEALAEIMEYGYATDKTALMAQLSCETSAALWSILSYKNLPTETLIHSDIVLRTFSALPSHLKSLLGPILSRRLLDAGYQDAAKDVLRILNRNDEVQSAEAKLANADIQISSGNALDATAALQEVVGADSRPSAEALVKLIETQLDADLPVSFDQVQLAGAYAYQYRREKIGRDLSRVYLLGLTAAGEFDLAYSEASRIIHDLETAEQNFVRSEMLGHLSKNAKEVTFLRYAFSEPEGRLADLTPQVGNTVATRLLKSGFPAQAKRFVSNKAVGEVGQQRQLIKARIALLENRPRQAEVELLGVIGTDADLIRAEAKSQAGEYKKAAKLFASSEQMDRSLQESWLAEDWDQISVFESSVLADVAKMINPKSISSALAANETIEPVLAHSRAMISDSASSRKSISALLDLKPMPAPNFE